MINSKSASAIWMKVIIASALLSLCLLGLVACADGDRNSSAAHNDYELTVNDKGTSQVTASDRSASSRTSDASIIMTLAGSAETYVLQGEDYLEAGSRAVSKKFGDITDAVEVSDNVDTDQPGDYEVTYSVADDDGNSASTIRTVHVVEDFDKASSIPVLMYHYVYDDANPPADLGSNHIEQDKLADQLSYLSENDYYYPSYQELRAFVDGTHSLPSKSVVLTFDDGEQGFLDYGIPLLEQFKVPATSFIIGEDPEAETKIIEYASSYVNFQSHTFGMHADGSSVGQGGIIHNMSEDEIYADMLKSKDQLGVLDAVAYPFGDNNETAWGALDKAGVLCAFTVEQDRVHPGDNPMALTRSRIFGDIEQGGFEWLVRAE